MVFPQIALAIGVLTSNLEVRDRDISRVVEGGMPSRVSLKVSYGVLVAALDRRTGWEVLPRCRRGCRWWYLIADVAGRCCGRCSLGSR